MLAVESVERARDFYVGKLGFTLLNSMEWEGRLGWAIVGAGGPSGPGKDDPWRVELMFSRQEDGRGGADRETRHGVILYLYPKGVEALHALYRSIGLPVTDLRVTFYKMKEFTIEDPDGYQVWFGEDTNDPPTPHA